MPKFNKQKTNNRSQRQPRQKVTPVIASSLHIDFDSAIKELRAASQIIDEYFEGIEVEAGYDEYVAYVAQKAAENIPALLEKKNIHTQYSISGTNVHVRTEDQLAFGWNTTYKVEDGQAVITSVKIQITMFDEFADLKAELENNGWELEERRPRR